MNDDSLNIFCCCYTDDTWKAMANNENHITNTKTITMCLDLENMDSEQDF